MLFYRKYCRRLNYRFCFLLLLMNCLLAVNIVHALESKAGSPTIKSKQPQEAIAQPANPRIAGFLEDIRRAGTLDVVNKKFARYRFNGDEIDKIKQITSTGAYTKKLQILTDKAEKSAVKSSTRDSLNQARQYMSKARLAKQRDLKQKNRVVMQYRRDPGARKQAQVRDYKTPSQPAEPKINSSSQVITPGRYVLLSGEGFGALQGRVSVKIGARNYKGTILHWQDDIVAFHIDAGITGQLSSNAMMTLAKVTGQKVRWPLQFVPAQDERHIHHWISLSVPAPSPVYIKKTHTYCDCKLKNEWKVVKYWRHKKTTGEADCDYTSPPVLGSDTPRARLQLAALGYSAVVCTHNAILRGPRGTQPYSGSCCRR